MARDDGMMNAGEGEVESRGPQMEAVACIFLGITWFFVILRVWVRGFMIKSWGWDDTTMILTLFLFSGYCVSMTILVQYGGGSRVTDPTLLDDLIKYTLATETLYVVTMVTLKISLGIFFLRICVKNWQIYTIWVVMVISTAYGVVYAFVIIFQCGNPSDYLTNRRSRECVPGPAQLGLAYSHAAVGAATDWIFAILPVFVLWVAKMDIRSKITVSIIILLGAIGSVATVVRAMYLWTLMVKEDFFYHAAIVAIWSAIEPGLGIAAASLATLRPLMRFVWHEARQITGVPMSSSSRTRGSRHMHLQCVGSQPFETRKSQRYSEISPRSPTSPKRAELRPESDAGTLSTKNIGSRSDEEASIDSPVSKAQSVDRQRQSHASQDMMSPSPVRVRFSSSPVAVWEPRSGTHWI